MICKIQAIENGDVSGIDEINIRCPAPYSKLVLGEGAKTSTGTGNREQGTGRGLAPAVLEETGD